MSQTTLTLEEDILHLPSAIRERYGLKSGASIRIIETKTGILLVPLTREPMDEALRQELMVWQEASWDALGMFPYDEEESGV